MRQPIRPAAITLLLAVISLLGCGQSSSPPGASADIDAESLYPPGATRDDLETRFGPGAFTWIYEQVPKDEFAAATIKAMVSIRKPRPAAYEVFLRRSASPGGVYYRDYVFYNDRTQVLYAARRLAN
jgi:hypothetical protein